MPVIFGTSMAVVFGLSLLVYLLLEEVIRGRYRPFLGLAKVKDLAGLRHAGFAAAVVVVIADATARITSALLSSTMRSAA